MDLQGSPEQLSPAEDHLYALRRRNPNPNPTLRPLSSTSFKRETGRQRRERKRQEKEEQLLLQQLEGFAPLTEKPHPPNRPNPTVSDVEWPCTPRPEPETTEWGWPWPAAPPDPGAAPPPPPPPVSAEEIARISAEQAQEKALRACRDFLWNQDVSDDEGEDDAIKFFVGLFEKNEELRGFYKSSWKKGKFCCLVCEGMGTRRKRFVNAAGLVHHSSTIRKTKRRAAHRAFGSAACQVLGWDLGRPPSSNLGMGEKVEEYSNTDVHPVEDIQERGCIVKRCDPIHTVNVDMMDCT